MVILTASSNSKDIHPTYFIGKNEIGIGIKRRRRTILTFRIHQIDRIIQCILVGMYGGGKGRYAWEGIFRDEAACVRIIVARSEEDQVCN
jgi:hypothetical protein